MSPMVPKYNIQIGLETANVPDAPSIDHSGNLTAMNKISAANEGLGKAASDIGDVLVKHAQEQQEIKNDQITSQAFMTYSQDKQNRYYDKSEETVKINGADITRPKGFMYRSLGQTNGSLEESDKWYTDNREAFLSRVQSPKHRAKLEIMMDRDYKSSRNTVANHEATEWRKDIVNTNKSALKEQIGAAYGADNPESLSIALDNGLTIADSLNRSAGYDEQTSQLNLQDASSKIIENSVIGKLKKTGDVSQANALLDAVKDKLPEKGYADLKEKITKIGDDIEKQISETAMRDKISNRLNYIDQIASGQLSWDNSGEAIKSVAGTDQELAEAMQRVILSPDYQAEENSNDGYQAMVKGIFNSSSQEEMSKFLVDALNAKANGEISRDRLSILVSAAKQRSSNVGILGSDSEGRPMSPAQIAIDSGLKAATGYYDKHNNPDILDNYLLAVMQNKTPQEALQIAISSHAVKVNPILQTINKNGRVMIDSYGNTATVFPDGTFEEVKQNKAK